MQSIQSVLTKFNPVEDKYISREFQSFGVYLAEELDDERHIALYIKLSKTVPRAILEKSLSFVKDANAKSKARLFMWKMKELKKPSEDVSSALSVIKVRKSKKNLVSSSAILQNEQLSVF